MNIAPIGTLVKTKNGDKLGFIIDFMACDDGNRYRVRLLGETGSNFIDANCEFFDVIYIPDNNKVLH